VNFHILYQTLAPRNINYPTSRRCLAEHFLPLTHTDLQKIKASPPPTTHTRTHTCTHARTHAHTHTHARAHTHTHTHQGNHALGQLTGSMIAMMAISHTFSKCRLTMKCVKEMTGTRPACVRACMRAICNSTLIHCHAFVASPESATESTGVPKLTPTPAPAPAP